MPQRSAFRPNQFTAILAVMLLVGMVVAGGVWHTHNGSSSDTCQVCHLSHQPAAQHPEINRISAPTPLSVAPPPADSARVSGPSLLFTVSRAPPTA